MAVGGADDGARGRGARSVLLGQIGFRQLAALGAAAAALAALSLAACGAADEGAGAGAGKAPAGTRSDIVESVTDGDTVRLRGLGKTRLIGIDTPEVYGSAECYGSEASSFTKRTLPPGTRVRYRIGVEPRDRYGRALAYLWLPDGRMLNRVLAAEGYAVPLTIPPNVDHAESFVAAARRARERRLGLWSPRTCAGDAGLPAGESLR